jgi:hypothetical protein
MTDSPTNETRKYESQPPRRELLPLPGLAAIALYLLVLAGVIVLGVAGGHYPALVLVLRWARFSCWRVTTCGSSPASVRGLRWCRGC